MIRIINEVLVSPATSGFDLLKMSRLSMIPASGTLESKETVSENGRSLTYKLALRCKGLSPAVRETLRDGCIVRVVCADQSCCAVDYFLGTEDIPLHFELEDNLDFLQLSATYKTVSRL